MPRSMSGVPAAVTPVDWPKDSQKFNIYINEQGMYELLFSSHQHKAKDSRKHCCNVLFPHVRQQLTNQMEEDHQQTITGIQEEHQVATEEHEQAVALLNDDLQEPRNRIQAIQYEDIGLQGEIRAKGQQIATLQRCYAGYISNEDQSNGTCTIAKNNE